MSDPAVAVAAAEVKAHHLSFTRGAVTVAIRTDVEGRPHVVRVDRDDAEGVVVYFGVENQSYFLAVHLDERPDPVIRSVDLEAGSEVVLLVSSTEHALTSLRAATSLEPTEAWDELAEGRTSGLSIAPELPLADDPEDNLRHLLDLLETDTPGVTRLASTAGAAVELTWYGTSHMPPLRLSPATLQRLADLGLALSILVAVT